MNKKLFVYYNDVRILRFTDHPLSWTQCWRRAIMEWWANERNWIGETTLLLQFSLPCFPSVARYIYHLDALNKWTKRNGAHLTPTAIPPSSGRHRFPLPSTEDEFRQLQSLPGVYFYGRGMKMKIWEISNSIEHITSTTNMNLSYIQIINLIYESITYIYIYIC